MRQLEKTMMIAVLWVGGILGCVCAQEQGGLRVISAYYGSETNWAEVTSSAVAGVRVRDGAWILPIRAVAPVGQVDISNVLVVVARYKNSLLAFLSDETMRVVLDLDRLDAAWQANQARRSLQAVPGVEIIHAIYMGNRRWTDVTDTVVSALSSDHPAIEVCDTALGLRPMGGFKTLVVFYTGTGNGVLVRSVTENRNRKIKNKLMLP